MVRRLALVSVVLFLFVGVATATAAPVQLVLPQGNAFSVLGYSCGGIQEQVYASGFDAATGYPDGFAYLSTRCGGSGRGGGYKTTTYTAWAAVSWDFAGTVISSARTTSATTSPGLAVYDAYGNELYNASGAAYLSLAPGFVPRARVSSISPSTGPAAGGATVTITGAGFTGATGVSFGSTPAKSFTVASSTTITAVAPAAAAGTVDVTVVNAGGASATLAADQFTFVAAPAVTAVAPKSGPVVGGTTVTITGSNFTGATAVQFGNARDYWFTIDSDTSITATAPAAEATGSVNVTVTTAGGRSATNTADRFTYTAPRPVVSVVDPASGPSYGGTVVTIGGSGFGGATRVTFGGVRATFGVQDDGTIVAYSPGGTAGSSVDVVVSGPGGTSAVSTNDRFSYSDLPVIGSVDPSSGPTAGGNEVTITGSGFSTASEVDFGGVPASFFVNDDTSIVAVAPGGAAGTVDVTVTGDGGVRAAASYTYADAAPTIDVVDPGAGPTAGGVVISISGSGFPDASEVDIGGVSTPFAVQDDTWIVALVPAGAAGSVDVTVIGPSGSSTAAGAFTYVDPPSVTGVDPGAGSVAGGADVTITGSGFSSATEVDFGGVAASFTVVDDGTIVAVAPAADAAGVVDVTVVTAGGTSDVGSADQFTYS